MNTLSSTHSIAASAASRAMNHVLKRESWACAELTKHAGKTILVRLPAGDLGFMIGASGFFEALKDLETPTLALEISPSALSGLVTSSGNLKEQAFKTVKITGDADLAQLIGRLAGQLRWEYEEDLAHFIGDAPAHFAVRQGKKWALATRSAAGDLLDNLVEYVSEEKKVLLNKRDFLVHKSELGNLRDAVDRLDKRIQLIEQRLK